MDSRYSRWLFITLFVALIVGWLAAALYTNAASAGQVDLPFNLRSRIAANYSPVGEGRFSSLRLTILTDFFRDIGINISTSDLDGPVPTATALNFIGDAPFTPTVTELQPTPTGLPSETPTLVTNVTVTMTHTALASSTPQPTKIEAPATNTPAADTKPPVLSEGEMWPPDGTLLPTCTYDISATSIHVVDPGPSSGMNWVRLKYSIEGQPYVYGPKETSPVSGGWTSGPGSTWDAYYKADVTVDFEDGFTYRSGKFYAMPVWVASTETPTPDLPTATPPPPTNTPVPATNTPQPSPTSGPYQVELWSYGSDNAGNEGWHLLGYYYLPGSCG